MARIVLGAVILFSLLPLVFSCAVNPVTGRQELMLISETDETRLGEETDRQVIEEYGIYDDPKLAAYAGELCRRLGRLSHRPNLNYQCKVLDSSVVNAFAVPGGYVYFTRGILAALNSEAELAGVMGHEIGHIAARHSAQQYSRAQLAQLGLGIGMIFADRVPGLSGLAQLGVGLLFMRFSRDNEREADDLAVEYATKAGYDAKALAEFFSVLERMNPGSDRSGLPGWFSTHPSPEDRVEAVRRRSREWQLKTGRGEFVRGRDSYLRQIDGLIYGEDPRQGYVAEHTFYHPQLRFQFPVPVNWKLNNTPRQVQMVSPGQEAVILFSLTAGNSPEDAARTFVSKTKAQVLKAESMTVNGLRAYRIVTHIQGKDGIVRVKSCFIQKGNRIFVFNGLSSPSLFGKYEPSFDNTMTRFRELTDSTRINVKVDRIRVRAAPIAGTVEEVLRSLGVPSGRAKEVALLNGKELSDRVEANALLKVIEKGM